MTARGSRTLADRAPLAALIVSALSGGYANPTERRSAKIGVPDKDKVHVHVMDTIRYAAVNFGPRVRNYNPALVNQIAKADILETPRYAY